MKRITYIFALLTLVIPMHAKWTTHFAYNSVDRVAAGEGIVYGVSSGALFSVEAQSEKIRTYSTQDGLHGSDIACIQWLKAVEGLMIVYADGRMDILCDGRFYYVPDLYKKYTTLSKRCHSVTVCDSIAYLAMDYGVQTFNIRRRTFVDTYFIGSEGNEVPVYSVALTAQAIYAAGDSVLYAAALDDNVVDYSYWSTVELPEKGKIQGIAQAKGVLYLLINKHCYRRSGDQWHVYSGHQYNVLNVVDDNIYPSSYPVVSCDGIWTAAGENGLIRTMITGEQVTYRLDGPLVNIPYRLSFQYGQLYVVQGGRWTERYQRPGTVMRYDGVKWCNVTQQEIVATVGNQCLDFMNVAVDPSDTKHYFATSYGTGLYEFQNDKCIKRWNPSNSIIGSAAPDVPALYTRTDGAIYDAQGNLWMMNAGSVAYNVVVFMKDGKQVGMNVVNEAGTRIALETASQILFDNKRAGYVWVLAARGVSGAGALALIDTKGTVVDTDDDRSLIRNQWLDDEGNTHSPGAIYAMRQDEQGDIWLATNEGVLIVKTDDYFNQAKCRRLQVTDAEGQLLMENEGVNDIVFDYLDRPWIAAEATGVYVLTPEADKLEAHYSTDNSTMPSNSVMSLACDIQGKRVYIGTALGLVAYTDPSSDVSAGDDAEANSELIDYGSMQQWTTHFSYTKVANIQLSPKRVYVLSGGSLWAVERDDESMNYYSKLNGLNGSYVHTIGYDTKTNTLVICYDDGLIDLLDDNGNVHVVADLYNKQLNFSKQANDLVFRDGKAYMAMPFGIMVLNIRKQEIADTYYIGEGGGEVEVNAITFVEDSIYAAVGNKIYSASLKDQLVDYSRWQSRALGGNITHLKSSAGNRYMLMDSVIYCNGAPQVTEERITGLMEHQGAVLALSVGNRIYEVTPDAVTEVPEVSALGPLYAVKESNTYWVGTSYNIKHLFANQSVQNFNPSGPMSNLSYSLTTCGRNLWMLQGGRWASQYQRIGWVMRSNGSRWTNIDHSTICQRVGEPGAWIHDLCHTAVDAADPEHYYIASFGSGLLEFMSDGTAKRYTYTNSPLVTLVADNDHYCRVDGLTYDPDGNLWLTNTGPEATNIHVIDPSHKWHSFNLYQGGRRIVLRAVSKFLVDNRNANYKWIASAREDAGIVLLYDNGTPYTGADDRAVMRSSFVDQDGKGVSINALYTIAQDYNGDLWLGTGEGIVLIKAETDMFTSDLCHRLKMSRHDDTGLADYLLGTEQINAIVFAGENRIWIGTEKSGVYLVRMVTNEGIYEPEILAHFTSQNSPMPSDGVLSIAVDDRGEVYIGTSKGLVSYRGDATEAKESYSEAYVYPNPVRPNFEGTITITGLMDNTTVYIADAAGNVVCRTHSNGGTAIWDGKTQSGKKAHSGVYTIYCNTADGKNHTTLKLMLMH